MGGAAVRQGEQIVPTFPRARYWTNSAHWQWASAPNPREKASFLPENLRPLQESGQLAFTGPETITEDLPFDAYFVDGHTEQQMLPIIPYKGQKLVYCADLIPSPHHIPLPWVMAYDLRPLEAMSEKEKVLTRAVEEGHALFFEHDPLVQCASVKATERGIRLDETFPLSNLG